MKFKPPKIVQQYITIIFVFIVFVTLYLAATVSSHYYYLILIINFRNKCSPIISDNLNCNTTPLIQTLKQACPCHCISTTSYANIPRVLRLHMAPRRNLVRHVPSVFHQIEPIGLGQ